MVSITASSQLIVADALRQGLLMDSSRTAELGTSSRIIDKIFTETIWVIGRFLLWLRLGGQPIFRPPPRLFWLPVIRLIQTKVVMPVHSEGDFSSLAVC